MGKEGRDGVTVEKGEWERTEEPEATQVERGRGEEERRGYRETKVWNEKGGSSAEEAADAGRGKVW